MLLGIGLISWATFSLYQATRPYVWTSSEFTSALSPQLGSERPLPLTEEFKTLYPQYPAEGDLIGKLTIPVLNRELPIFQGTGTAELKKGVGHYLGSVLPGEEDNSVLSGHRDTVFVRLDVLKEGDLLIEIGRAHV